MKNQLLLFGLLFLFINAYSAHPRLYISDTNRLVEIRNAMKDTNSFHYQAYKAIKYRVDNSSLDVYDANQAIGYRLSWKAREAAFLTLLTTNYSDKVNYATKAYNALITDNTKDRYPTSGDGLKRAMMCLGYAMAYDWCYNIWTSTQRTRVLDTIKKALDKWPSYSHTNLSPAEKASNWVAVCRSGELIAMLASDQETSRSSRYLTIKSDLLTHTKNAYGTLGYSQEGIGYTGYGGSFLFMSMLALKSVGDNALESERVKHEWHKLFMMAGTYDMNLTTNNRFFQASGTSGGDAMDEGAVSLVMGFMPDAVKPFYKYFYERHAGLLAPGKYFQKFDEDRAGTVWAMLYYPEKIIEQNAKNYTSRTLADTKTGMYLFRNSFDSSPSDIMIQFTGDFVHHDNAWDCAEAFFLHIYAYGTRYSGGPDKIVNNNALYSTLLVNGAPSLYNTKDKEYNTTHIGAFDTYTSDRFNGGYVIVDGGTQYSNLGLSKAKRHLNVFFDSVNNNALLGVLDDLTTSSSKTYTWQFNIGNHLDNGGITVTNGTEGGRKYFLLKGANNGWVKGWFLSPSTGTLTATADPVKYVVTATSTKIFTTLLIGKGTPPVATITGTDMSSELSVGKYKISYNSISNRMIITNLSVKEELILSENYENSIIENYPNPFKTYTNIEFSLSKISDINFQLIDLNGNVVDEHFLHKLMNGIHTIRIDAGDLKSGVYICKFTTDDGMVMTKKIILQK